MNSSFVRLLGLPALVAAALPACQPLEPLSARDIDPSIDQRRYRAVEETLPPCTDPGEPEADAYDPATGPGSSDLILPNGRAITPSGEQLQVGTFPMNLVTSHDGRYVFVTNNGYAQQSIMQIDVATRQIVATVEFDTLFNGLALSSDGTRLYAAGGGLDEVYVLSVSRPGLSLIETWPVDGYPTGLALSPDDTHLLVTSNLGSEVQDIDTQTGIVRRTVATEHMPYQVIFGRDGTRAYVSQWSAKLVSVIDMATFEVIDTLSTAKNPSGMALSSDGETLYVAAADGDLIEAYNTVDDRLIREQAVGSNVEGLHGASPNSLALGPDGMIYVANGGENAVEVYDADKLYFQGAIPTGWYPSALALTPDGATLIVANGKGEGAGPNPTRQYSPKMMIGTVSFIDLPWTSSQLADGDAQVIENNSRPTTLHQIDCDGKMFPIPSEGQESPIQHIVVIMRENKTYDADLGDLEVGNGDPDLVLFGEQVTPNLHALAREFTVLDNFYTDSEVSTQGHLWSVGNIVNDYSERTWIEGYRTGLRPNDTGVSNASDPQTRYLFDHLWENGIDWVNYGQIVGFGAITWRNMDLHFPGVVYNTYVKDQVKAEYVVSQIEAGVMPTFTYLLLPNDHTNGTDPGKLTPESMVSDNDYATGLVVDAISRSPYWSSTVIFIFEDDTQIGADHVEAHRSPAVVVSPWTKRGHVSSVHYSMPSIFRTFGLILGIPPINEYDALATPMYDVFTAIPDETPYEVRPRQIPDARNPPDAVGADESRVMDFDGPDRNPGLGPLLWRYIKKTPPPPMLGAGIEEREDPAHEAYRELWRLSPEED